MEMPLYEKGRSAGTVLVEQRGEETMFVVTADLAPGLYRVAVRGEGGELLLGVMEGGRNAALRRRFSRTMTCGVGRVCSAEVVSCSGGREEWRAAGEAEKQRLPLLPPGALCRRQGTLLEVALPAPEEQPFPLAERFCLARLCRMEGRRWAVFTFNETGEMIFPREN